MTTETTYKVMVLQHGRKRRRTLYRGVTLQRAKDAVIAHVCVARANRVRAVFYIEQEPA